MVLFKRGAKIHAVPKKNTDSDDTEKASQITTRGGGLIDEEKSGDYDKALKATPSVTDVFSWQHLTYTVPVADGKRRLLNGVSGFVAPGKLTALMGESGAGKVRFVLFSCGKCELPADYPVLDDSSQCLGRACQHWCHYWRPVRQWTRPSEGFPISNVCLTPRWPAPNAD